MPFHIQVEGSWQGDEHDQALRTPACDDFYILGGSWQHWGKLLFLVLNAVVDGRAVSRPSTAAAFLASLGSGDEPWVERMFAPKVDVRGDFAFAQMDYDFHRGGAFSHHGVDQFLLVRDGGRWRVASIAYSVVRGGGQSPFGGL